MFRWDGKDRASLSETVFPFNEHRAVVHFGFYENFKKGKQESFACQSLCGIGLSSPAAGGNA